MVEAVFNGQVIVRSEYTVQMEGNDYFPPASIRSEFLTVSRAKSRRAATGPTGFSGAATWRAPRASTPAT